MATLNTTGSGAGSGDLEAIPVAAERQTRYFLQPRRSRDVTRLSLVPISWLASAAILPIVSSVLLIPSASCLACSGPPRATVSAAFER